MHGKEERKSESNEIYDGHSGWWSAISLFCSFHFVSFPVSIVHMLPVLRDGVSKQHGIALSVLPSGILKAENAWSIHTQTQRQTHYVFQHRR